MMVYAGVVLLIGLVLLFILWAGANQEIQLHGTYRVQCNVCKEIEEIHSPTVQQLRDHTASFNADHRDCIQRGTGP